MKTIEEIRRENLKKVCKLHKQKVVADKIDSDPSYLSQVINKTIKKETGKPKELGSETARKIETEFDLEYGWMDNDHLKEELHYDTLINQLSDEGKKGAERHAEYLLSIEIKQQNKK